MPDTKDSYRKKQDEHRVRERRAKNERRDMVRWEPERRNRRTKKDRRKSSGASWDDVLIRRR
ncbi:MAG TPA: hypothetical protein VIH66_03910 [Gammaproteobacteria bacterium]